MEEVRATGTHHLRSLLLAAIAAGGAALFFALAYSGANLLLPPSPQGGLWSLCSWDCGWYKSVVENGYHTIPDANNGRMVANYGFFPGFPLSVGLLMRATGFSFVAAGVALNAFYSLLFCWIALRHYRELELSDEWQTMVFLAAFLLSPWSLYNHVPYSEMLFNLSALGTFVYWRRGNYAAAAAFGVVLTGTRLSGIILPLVLLAELLIRERGQVIGILLRPDGRFRALAIMPLGLAAFLVFLFLHIGDPLAYFHIQQTGWGQGLRNPLAILVNGVGVGPRNLYAVIAYFVASAVILAGLVIRRIPFPLASFAWLVPSVSLASMLAGQARYALALFPLYLIVPALPRTLQLLLIPALALGQAALVYYWIQLSPMLV